MSCMTCGSMMPSMGGGSPPSPVLMSTGGKKAKKPVAKNPKKVKPASKGKKTGKGKK